MGGQTPGSAELEATARSRGTPDDGPQSWSWPVKAFTAAARKFSGHDRPLRAAIVGRVTAAFSSTVSRTVPGSSAVVPIAFHCSSGAEETAALAHATASCSNAALAFV